MSTGRIYYSPESTGPLFTIDLNPNTGEYPGQIQRPQITEVATATRGDGKSYAALLSGVIAVRITCDAWVDTEQVRLLRQWENHVKRGELFGFTLDKDKAWGTVLQGPSPQGAVSSIIFPHRWYEPTVSLTSSDEIVFEEPPPRFRVDLVTSGQSINQTTSGALTHGALGYEFSNPSNTHVRWRDFYPLLRLDPDAYGQEIIISEREQYFKLNLFCVYEMRAAIEVAQTGQVSQVGGTQGIAVGEILGQLESQNPFPQGD